MAPAQPGASTPLVQRVIDFLERSRTSRSSPGSGWFADAMRGLLDISVSHASGAGPSSEDLDRLWDAVHRMAVEHPEKFIGFATDAEDAVLSARGEGWEPASWRRSVLEFLRVHPRFAAFDPLSDDDMVEINSEFRRIAKDVEPLPDDAIPNGVPTSHWWWWAPSAHYSA